MPGRVSSGPPKVQKPKAPRKRKNRALDAFAIAEKELPDTLTLRESRYGEIEGPKRPRRDEGGGSDGDEATERRPKRLRPGDRDAAGDEVEGGSDSDGNEWVTGRVPSDEDSDIDSDDAFGDSDEEKFTGFTFRGSQSSKPRKSKRATRELDDEDRSIDLDEEEEASEDESDAESEGFAAEAVDLAAVLDQRDSESEAEDDPPSKRKPKRQEATEGKDDDDDHSVLSVSEDEVDGQDKNFDSLQSFVAGLGGGKTKKAMDANGDSHEALAPSEYGVTSRQKLTIDDLLPTVTDPKARKTLRALAAEDGKAPKTGSGIPQRLSVPLPKRQQDRIDRAAAYDKSKETLSRWIETVKHNRRAEHLSFPLPDPEADYAQSNKHIAHASEFKPITSLENTIQSILEESGMSGKNGKTQDDYIQEMEELETRQMPIEELRARRAELRRARDLLFREEVKSKRIKKIKSKAYRRVHRKARERELVREQEALVKAGVDPDEEEIEKLHRIRAEERMGARHRASKWAKAIKSSGRAAWDEDARAGINEMARREEELMKRVAGKDIDADSLGGDESDSEAELDSEDEDDDAFAARMGQKLIRIEDEDKANVGSRLSNLPFMKKAEAANRARNDEAIEALRKELDKDAGSEDSSEEKDEDDGDAPGRRAFGPKSMNESTVLATAEARNEFEEPEGPDDRPTMEFHEQELEASTTSKRPTARPTESASKNSKGRLSATPKEPEKSQQSGWLPTPDTEKKAATTGWLAAPKRHRSKQLPLNDAAIALSVTAPDPTSAAKPVSKPKHTPITLLADPDATSSDGDSDSNSDSRPTPRDAAALNARLKQRAFAGNDDAVAADFAAEKAALEASEDAAPDDADPDALPGWGSWVGNGLSKADKRRGKKAPPPVAAIKDKKKERQDAARPRVIVSEKRAGRSAPYMADQLPHPFESRAQYERSLRLPIGQEWSTVGRFQEATKPRLLVKKGRVIAPMRRPLA